MVMGLGLCLVLALSLVLVWSLGAQPAPVKATLHKELIQSPLTISALDMGSNQWIWAVQQAAEENFARKI